MVKWRSACLAATSALLGFLIAADALGGAGVRLGGWRPGPVPVALTAAAWTLVTLILRPGRRGVRYVAAAGMGALLVGLVLVVWPVPLEQNATEAWEVRGRSTLDRRLPTTATLTLDRLRTPRRVADALGRSDDLDLEILGYLTVPESGRYRFHVECGGSCSLAIDGREILRGRGTIDAEAGLEAGDRVARATLAQPGTQAFLRMDWERPSFWQASRLSDAGGAVPPGLERVRARERGALVGAAGQWLLGSGFALLGLSLCHAVAASRTRLREWGRDPVRRKALALGGGAALLLAALHAWIAPRALPGGYLHPWTSEYMMQTVSVADLRAEPARSLVYLHIQPPLFDGIRAVVTACNSGDGETLMRAVDRGLYAFLGLVYGAAVALVAVWLSRLCGTGVGLAGAALFAVHPAVLFYATFLDSTFLSSALMLWLIYELWRPGPAEGVTGGRLIVAVIALFLTRSLVQWPFIAVLAAALWLRGCPRPRAIRVVCAVTLAIALYAAKQYALFGLTITSSFGPDSFCKGLSAYCPGSTEVPLPHPLPPPHAASVLRRIEKLNGEYNYNQLAFLRRSFSQMEEYKRLLRALSPGEAARLLAHNLDIWLRPSSRHSHHVLVDALPWRGAFDVLFSGWRLVALLLLAVGAWIHGSWPQGGPLRPGLGLALPVVYAAAASIAFESGENMRYKFFVEPVLFIFIWSQLAAAFSALAAGSRGARRARVTPGVEGPGGHARRGGRPS